MVGALAAALITTLATLADASDHGSSKLNAGGLKNGTMELVMIPAGEPALAGSCLDGSPFGMYQLLNESSPNWIIYFDGGILPGCLLSWPAAGCCCRCCLAAGCRSRCLQRQHADLPPLHTRRRGV